MAAVSLVTVTELPVKGQALVAVRDIAAGELILKEAPLFVVPKLPKMRFRHIDQFCLRRGLPASPIYCALQLLTEPAETQSLVRSLYCPQRSQAEQGHLGPLLASMHELEPPPGTTREWMETAFLTYDANCMELNGEGATAVYATACRACHSCLPNAYWHSDDEDNRLVYAVREIRTGEEVTVSYLSSDELLLPAYRRRAILLRTKNFLCSCPRCSQPADPARPIRCPVCGDDLELELAMGTDCGVDRALCRRCGPSATLGVLAAAERRLSRKLELLESTPALCTERNLSELICEVQQTLHPDYWVVSEAKEVLRDRFVAEKRYAETIPLLLSRLRFVRKVFPELSPKACWLQEFLGDALGHFPAATPLALKLYTTALKGLSLLYPEGHEYLRDITEKIRSLPDAEEAFCSCSKKAIGKCRCGLQAHCDGCPAEQACCKALGSLQLKEAIQSVLD